MLKIESFFELKSIDYYIGKSADFIDFHSHKIFYLKNKGNRYT